jgi:polysaccharide chain length determinant protein (PEP-CTERM system associated)
MQEILAQVFSYVWGVWRHRWLALGVAWGVAVAGWLWVWQLPESYVATARVYVDTNSVLRPLLRGLAIEPNIDQRISMMSRTLLSRPNLEKLMRMTDLDLQVNTEAQKNAMLAELSESISLSGSRDNESLYAISVSDPDREVAKKITQSLITVFIESSLSGKREDSSGAQDFLDEQIREYEERLVAAENRLALFKQENVDVLPGSGGDYYSTLQLAKENLAQARLQLSELENRKLELQRQLDGEEPIFISSAVTAPTSSGMSPLDSRIQSMKAALDSLTIRYTDKHPEVRQLSAMIKQLEVEKASEYRRVREDTSAGFSGLSNSPVYQGMRSMLAETEAGVAELQVRVAEYERRVNDLVQKVNNVPEIEAQLKQLDRDYTVIAGQHKELLERREAARLSQDVEQNASDVTFRVIDPPFVPLEPSEPNKLLLDAAVLLLGLAAGVGAGLLVSLIRPVISDARTLVSLTGMPLLGTVSVNLLPEQKRRETKGLLTFAALSTGLLIVFFGMTLGQSGMLSS